MKFVKEKQGLIICDLELALELIKNDPELEHSIIVPMWIKRSEEDYLLVADEKYWDQFVDSGVVAERERVYSESEDVTDSVIPVEWIEKRIEKAVGPEHTYLQNLLNEWRDKEYE